MNHAILIGITGCAGAGKDTIANRLCASHGFTRLAFADRLKEIVALVFDVPVMHFHDRDLKNANHPNLHPSTIERLYCQDRGLLDVLIPVLCDLYDKKASEIIALGWDHIAADFFCRLLPKNGCSPRLAVQLIGTEGFRERICDTTWLDYVLRKAVEHVGKGQSTVITDVRFSNEFQGVKSVNGVMWGVQRDNAEQYDHASEREVGRLIDDCDHVLWNNGTIDGLITLADIELIGVRGDISRSDTRMAAAWRCVA